MIRPTPELSVAFGTRRDPSQGKFVRYNIRLLSSRITEKCWRTESPLDRCQEFIFVTVAGNTANSRTKADLSDNIHCQELDPLANVERSKCLWT